MTKKHRRQDNTAEIEPYRQESLLIDSIPQIEAETIICTSAGLAQFAAAAAQALPHATVICTYIDLYRTGLASEYWKRSIANLLIECVADLPKVEADTVVLPFFANGEAELTRDLIQSGHQRLRLGGKMYASTNNRKDAWLWNQLQKVFRKLDRHESRLGALYVGTKTEPLKKLRNFSCEFAFRDRGRLIQAYSRPGVFSHRHIDPGARHLINEMQIETGARVLDIGCGSGTVALAAAFRADGVQVDAVDSNVRAIQCAQRGAELNGLANVTTELNAAGNYARPGTCDIALANPPYYANFQIAEHFLIAGREALRPGGEILVVTKQADWYEENMPEWFDNVTIAERKGYFVIHGRRPSN
jgi:16S rRNA G1207 methylase RsmC